MLHAAPERTLRHYGARPPHGLLIVGPRGADFDAAVALVTASRPVVPLYPQVKGQIDLNGTITIDHIRELVHDSRVKHTSDHFVVVHHADTMTHQAQNAFLKLLEEPGEHAHFILLATETTRLLPTVLSRVQTVELPPITAEQATELLDTLGATDPARRSQLLFMAAGLPEELRRLASDDTYFAERAESIKAARTLLQGTAYEKIKVVHAYRSSASRATQLVGDAIRIVRHTLVGKPSTELIATLDRLYDVTLQLEKNASPRLQLLRLVVY